VNVCAVWGSLYSLTLGSTNKRDKIRRKKKEKKKRKRKERDLSLGLSLITSEYLMLLRSFYYFMSLKVL
jgi:hypothetical protein